MAVASLSRRVDPDTVQKWFEEHNKFEVLSQPPNYTTLTLIEYLWDMLDKQAWWMYSTIDGWGLDTTAQLQRSSAVHASMG